MRAKKRNEAVFLSLHTRVIVGIVLGVLSVCILGTAMLVVFEDHPESTAPEQVRVKPAGAPPEPEGWPMTAGRAFGLVAATILFYQFGLSSKLKFLDRVFGLHRVLYLHRILGLSLVIFASLHPLFMFASNTENFGPLNITAWPKFVGIILLIGLWTGVAVALWRKFLSLPYHKWYFMHRLGMFSAMVIFILHVSNVTDDFHHGWPLYGLGAALLLYAALFAWIIILKPVLLKRSLYTVTGISPLGKDTHYVELVPAQGDVFPYAPGQFAFVTFFSERLPVERHHWTLSSTPTRPKSCIFTIKSSGDFTALIGRLQAGDKAAVDGSYGHFSHLAYEPTPEKELVMIAGGIGITPFLSILRYMVDTGDERKATLIWSNRTEDHIMYRQELEGMKEKLPHFTIHHVLSRQKEYQGHRGHLTQEMLQELLAGHSREAAVFICGPQAMMDEVRRNMKNLDFRGGRIHREKFSY